MELNQIETKACNVLVTRPQQQANTLCKLIEQQGCNAIRFPTLQITVFDHPAIKQQLMLLNQYHWLIFISSNAVNFALRANNGKIEPFKQCSIAAIGKATEKALKIAGLSVKLIPALQFNTEGLLATPEMQAVAGQSCLIIRGKGGRETLANRLRIRGAQVDYMEVYLRERPVFFDTTVIHMIRQGKIDAITITSGNALKNLLSMIDREFQDILFLVPIIVVSKRLKGMAKKCGFKYIAVTQSPEDSAITESVLLSLGSSIN